MHFFVKSITKNGKTGFEFIESQNYTILLKRLQQEKATPINIWTLPSFISKIVPTGEGKVSPDEVVELMESLHLVIKSGLPLYEGLQELAKESDNKRFRNMMLYIADAINNGKSLSAAFEAYKSVIGTIILNLIKIGEETGQLESTLKRAAEFLKRTIALKKKAKGALIYPTFAFVAVLGAMLVWMIYVLPQMLELFKSMDIKLPPLTLGIIAVSNFLSAYWVYMLASVIVFIITFKILHKKYQRVRFYTDKMILKIPVIKQIISGFNIAFISEYLRLALVSGVPIFNALQSLTDNLKNEVFKEALALSTTEVSKGSQISAAFSKTGIFTPFTVRMIGVGESSGSLDSQLDLISEHYYERVNYFAENIGKVIEPVVLIFVGGFMALVIAGLLGPMYDLISQIK
jgi:type II secretory pathway component PulF